MLWVNQNFLLLEEIEAVDGRLDVAFQSLRTHTPLVIRMRQNGAVGDFHLIRYKLSFDFLVAEWSMRMNW